MLRSLTASLLSGLRGFRGSLLWLRCARSPSSSIPPSSEPPGREAPGFCGPLLEAIAEPAVLLDAKGRLLLVNTRFQRVVSQSAAMLEGRQLQDFLHPDDKAGLVSSLTALCQAGSTAGTRQVQQRLGDHPFSREWRYTRLAALDGEQAGALILGHASGGLGAHDADLHQAESILAAVGDPVSLVDRDYVYRYVNQYYERLFGKPCAAIIGEKVASFLGQDVFVGFIKAKLDRCFDGETVAFDGWYELQPGCRFYMSMTYRPYRDASGRVVAAAITGRDNSALARARAQTELVLAKYQAMFDHFPLGILVTDAQGTITELNSVANQLLEETFGHSVGRRIDVDDWGLLDSNGHALPAALSPAVRAWHENRVMADQLVGARRPDGAMVWFNVTAAPLPLRNQGVVIAFEEVTERRLSDVAQRELASMRDSERRFRLMADGVPMMLWGTDTTGELEFANAGFRLFFGLQADPANRPGPIWPQLLHRDDLELFQNALCASVLNQDMLDIQCRVRRRDGDWRWMQVSAQPHPGINGEVVGLVGAMQDISARRQTELELHKSRDQLRGRAERLARLTLKLTLAEQRERQRIGGLLHDHLQQDMVAAKYQLEKLASLPALAGHEEIGRASGLINQAIRTGRSLNADLHPLPLYKGSCAAALEWLARTFQDRHGLHIHARVEQDVELDSEDQRILIFESVREVLLNVVKHAGVRDARVTLRVAEPAAALVLRIEDAGRGFAQESIRPGDLGPGFGLLAIRERIAMLDGTLVITSGPGLPGTRVCITVPLRSSSLAGVSEPSFRLATSGQPRPLCNTAGRQRVLLADDHVMVRQALANLLNNEPDLQVIGEASDGYEAIEMAQCLQPDVVVMDMEMPELDGIAATLVIRERWPRVRVIALRMSDDDARIAEILHAGAEDTISKSDVIEALLDCLRAGDR